MSDGMRTWRLAGGRRHLGGLVSILCALICATAGDAQAGPPGGDPVPDRVIALVGRVGGEVRLDEQATGRPIVEIRRARRASRTISSAIRAASRRCVLST